jgi:hypothetical protein
MKNNLREILNVHKQTYNDFKIEDISDITKREAILSNIEEFYSYVNLNDVELRNELKDIGLNQRIRLDELDSESEEYFTLACRIEYWYTLTDDLKTCYIVGE